ncbi:SDR family oxidoreductase [Streptomyces sp. x-19]|uniref:SDR family oxidoreductase n=1 Tax=Streptomyces sp. x-19 TaxID=2789280 RepID=UPI0039803252
MSGGRPLLGRTALVTGGNKGLGLETCRALAMLGVTVLLASRDAERGEQAAGLLRDEGLDVHPVVLDVTRPAQMSALAEHIRQRAGRLDVLVNNAGIMLPWDPWAPDADTLRRVYETNVFGLASVTGALLPLLREATAPRIVNVTSTTSSLSLISEPGSPLATDYILAYASSKTAVNMITVQYALAFARSPDWRHMKVNAATPGFIATDLNGHTGPRTAAEGARVVVDLATLPPDGPSGGFFNEVGPLPW